MAVSETDQTAAGGPPKGTGYRRALMLVIDAGSTLLENGGEVFRVQQTMQIMANSLGITDFNVYVLANGIFVSSHGRTEIRHVPATAIHLGRVEALNELSRELAAGKLDLPGAEARLAQIRQMSTRRAVMLTAASAAGSACFAYLFGWLWWRVWRKVCCPSCAGAKRSAGFSPTFCLRRQAPRLPWSARPFGRGWMPTPPSSVP